MVVHLLTTKKQREMKKFWNLLVAVLVVMGAVACTENYENVDGTMEQGLSFRATINLDETRSDVVFNESTEKWNTVWTGDETLNVRVGWRSYQFTNSVEDKELFVCKTANASDLVGQGVVIDLMHDADGAPIDSKAGKSGGKIYASVSSFNPAEGVALEVKSAFFRYSSAYEVTLDASSYIFYYNDGYKNSITLPAGDDVWVAFNPLSDVTLSYSIDGTKCKEITKNFESKKVYNLGELGLPYEVSETWGIVGAFNGWAAGTPAPLYVVNEWLVAYGLTNLNGGFKFVQNKSLDNAKGGVPVDGVSATGEWLSCGSNNITAADASAYDVYFAPERSMYCIVVAGATVPEMPEAPVLPDWSLAGSFNNWGDLLMTATDTAYLYVAEGVTLATGDEIKVKRSDTWDVSYGGGINNLEPNKWMKAYLNGSNVVVAKSGTYDVYFEYADGGDYSKLYLVEAGESQSAATEQTANGTLVPDGSDTPEGVTPDEPSVWSLSGTFNGWGDAVMVTTTVKDIFVAKSVSFAAYDAFKVRKNKAWTENYGGGIVYFNPNGWMSVYSNGSDIAITEAGTYDVYFDLTNKRLYVVDAGGDYTTVAQQTTEGKEPEVEEPEVTENVLYLKPNSNWKQSNARFAAYFFINNDINVWVSMVDSDSDGIYEVNIPEGYTFGDNVIFCRMNPSSTANNWNNKWNQTADLKIPTDGKNLFTIPGTTWDGATNSNWSVKE